LKLFEKLGIPENIYEVTEHLFKEILIGIPSIKKVNSTNQLEIVIDDKIADLHLKKCNISIKIKAVELSDISDTTEQKFKNGDLVLYGMAVSHHAEKEIKSNKYIVTPSDVLELFINIISIGGLPSNLDLELFFLNNSTDIIKSLGHEIKHKFDNHKNRTTKIIPHLQYNAYQSIHIPIKAVSNFLHNLYYTTTIENLVRTSEVYSKMRSVNVNKDNFKEFLSAESTYQRLTQINNFTVDKLKSDIKLEMQVVNEIINENCPDDVFIDDDAKVDRILEFIYIGLCNTQIREYRDFLTSSYLETIFGIVDGKKKQMFDQMSKEINKYENNISKFYTDIEKMFIFVSNKYMKKISKLYDMIKSDQKSINNWELHQRINLGKPTRKMESKIIDYETFLRKKK